MSVEVKFHLNKSDPPVEYHQSGGHRWLKVVDPVTRIEAVIWFPSPEAAEDLANSMLNAAKEDPRAKGYSSGEFNP